MYTQKTLSSPASSQLQLEAYTVACVKYNRVLDTVHYGIGKVIDIVAYILAEIKAYNALPRTERRTPSARE